MPIDLLCAVCFDANEANRNAFLFMTLFMSLAPLTKQAVPVQTVQVCSPGGSKVNSW